MSPTAPGTPCPSPGCPEITPPGEHCAKHKSEKWDDDRPSFRERGYDSRWTKVSRRYRAKNPLCERCKAQDPPITREADVVHHKTPVQEGGAKYDVSNLESLCHTHHNREHDRG